MLIFVRAELAQALRGAIAGEDPRPALSVTLRILQLRKDWLTRARSCSGRPFSCRAAQPRPCRMVVPVQWNRRRLAPQDHRERWRLVGLLPVRKDLDLTVRAALDGWHGIFVSEPPIPDKCRGPAGLSPPAEALVEWLCSGSAKDNRSLGDRPDPTQRLAPYLVAHQIFFPAAAIGVLARVLGTICMVPSALSLVAPDPAAMTTVVVLGIPCRPTLAERGPVLEYLQTMRRCPHS